MKKLIPILIIFSSILMLSGCEFHLHPYRERYTMFFKNNTTSYVYDWYVKDDFGMNHTGSTEYYPVAPGETSSINNLWPDYYEVWFCLLSTDKKDLYLHSETMTYLDSDTVFELKTEKFLYKRSISSATNETSDDDNVRYILVDSKGNEYPLIKDSK